MTIRLSTTVASLVVAVATAAGCTSVQAGTPTADPDTTVTGPAESNNPSTSTSPTKDTTYGAPRVTHPLDASKFLKQPCAVLTPAQLAELSVTKPGEPHTDSEIAKHAGPQCIWDRQVGTPLPSTIDVGFLTGNENGLSDTYRGRSRFGRFEETTVEGYPAVFDDLSDERPHGNCNITVGISDTLTFRAREGAGPHGQEVCERAKQVAAMVLATLKAGA